MQPTDEMEDNLIYRKMKATPPCPNISNVFLNVPTQFVPPSDAHRVFVVSEVRSAYGKTQRRLVGAFSTRRDAERKAADIRLRLVRFLERYNGTPFEEEMNGGVLLEYWVLGNPAQIVGYAVTVEECVVDTF